MPSNNHKLVNISRKDISFKDVMIPEFFGKRCDKNTNEYKNMEK